MMRMLPLVLVCGACAPMAPVDQAAPPESGAQCDAGPVQDLIGKAGDEAVVADARKRSGSRTVRRYATGSALTMDFRPDRLNVEVGADGRIVKLGCG